MPAQNDQTGQAFSYDDAKLPSSKNHFRLLDLYPSPDHSAPIICDISCHRIDSHKPFTALSYVWASPDRTDKATVCGKELGITRSLDEALRYLRDRDSVVTLWIDQICIHQDDNEEKSHQVRLMGEIYGAAEQTFVWLGPEANGSDQVMDLWRDIGQAARDLGMESYWTKERVYLLSVIGEDGVLDENDPRMKFRNLVIDSLPHFRSLLKAMVEWNNRSWFQRVWVVQEFALSRKVPVYICGNKRVEAHLVKLAMCVYRYSCGRLLENEPSGSESRRNAQNLMNELRMPDTLFSTARRQRQAFDGGRSGAGDSLLDLLRRMYMENGMDSTDERDRILAVLGLATDSKQLGLLVDYTIEDCGPIYAKAAKAMIQKAGRLEVLSYSQFPKASYPRLKTPLPTWAPDWRSYLAPSYHPLVIERAGSVALYSPSRGALPSFLETADENVLGLKGVAVCIVMKVGDEWTDGDWTDAGHHRLRVKHLATIEDFCKESAALGQSIYTSTSRRDEAVYRVPIGDIYRLQSGERVRVDKSGQSMMELYTLWIQNTRHAGGMGTSEDGRFVAEFDDARNGISYGASMSFMSDKRPFLAKEAILVWDRSPCYRAMWSSSLRGLT